MVDSGRGWSRHTLHQQNSSHHACSLAHHHPPHHTPNQPTHPPTHQPTHAANNNRYVSLNTDPTELPSDEYSHNAACGARILSAPNSNIPGARSAAAVGADGKRVGPLFTPNKAVVGMMQQQQQQGGSTSSSSSSLRPLAQTTAAAAGKTQTQPPKPPS